MNKIESIAKASKSKSFRELNPDLFKSVGYKIPYTACGKVFGKTLPFNLPIPKKSPLAIKFEVLWDQIGGPLLTPEYKFHPTRKWRFDYCQPCYKVAIELNGAVWTNGRHTRGSGYVKDLEKMNEAQFLGFKVIQLHNATITVPNLRRIADLIG